MEEVFRCDGPLTRLLAGYEARPEQLEVAVAVERALKARSYLLAEAGTGTGKTLAYLIPAALSGRKVVISTATKTLQEQLFFKDIPLVRAALGIDLSAAYLKGRSNYLCIDRFSRFDAAPRLADPREVDLWPKLRTWALSTQTGDRAESDLPDGLSAWADLTTTAHTCTGTRCVHYDACFVTQARRRAESASLVIVNHALFFADLAIRSRRGEGVLPAYEAVIFDEAHALEDAATDSFGAHVSNYRFDELARDAQAALPSSDERGGLLSALALKASGVADRFFRAVPRTLGLSGGGGTRLQPHSLKPLTDNVAEVGAALDALSDFAKSSQEPQVEGLQRRADELGAELQLMARADSNDHVFWAEQRGRGVFLRSAPIDIAGELRKRLYSGVDTAVFTSATLRAGATFHFFRHRLGLDALEELGGTPVEEVAVESPFDYPKQAALYAPSHLPEPNDPEFVDAVAEEIVELAHITGGRALALFTSLRNMESAWERARHRLPWQVLLQGERPRSALLESFRSEPSVLFASQSFWEGIDVPGAALSLVVIDKLPFASPGDPLVAARMDRLRSLGEEPFQSFQLPEAALALRQGFGRLIRSKTDRGIVAVLDRRMVTRAYGRVFWSSLPKAARFQSRDALKRWFADATARAT